MGNFRQKVSMENVRRNFAMDFSWESFREKFPTESFRGKCPSKFSHGLFPIDFPPEISNKIFHELSWMGDNPNLEREWKCEKVVQ